MAAPALYRWLKYTGFAVAALIVLTGLCLLAAYIWLDTDSGRRWLSGQIEDRGGAATGAEISVSGLSGHPLRRFTIARVSITEPSGADINIETLSARWKPLALLRGRLHVGEITIGDLSITGAEQEGAGDNTFSLPSLPVLPLDLEIRELSVESIRRTGMETVLTLNGSILWYRAGVIDTRLSAAVSEGGNDRLQAVLLFEPDRDELDLAIHLQTAPGGFFNSFLPAALMERRAALEISGSGPTRGWQGDVVFTSDGQRAVTGSLSIDEQDQASKLMLDVTGEDIFFDNIGVPELAGLPVSAGISLTLERRRPTAFEIRADYQDSWLIATGDLSREPIGALHIGARLTPPYPALLSDLAIAEAIVVSGALQAQTRVLNATITARQINTGTVSMAQSENRIRATLLDRTLDFKVDATIRDALIRQDNRSMALPVLEWSLEGDYGDDRLNLRSLAFDGDHFTGTLAGFVSLASDEGELDGRIQFDDLAAWQGLVGRPVEGTAIVDTALLWPDGAQDFVARGSAEFDRLKTGDERIDNLFGAAPVVEIMMSSGPDDERQIQLSSQGSRGSLSVLADSTDGFETVSAPFKLHLSDLAPVLDLGPIIGSGSLTVDGRITGPVADPDVRASMNIDRLLVNQLQIDDLVIGTRLTSIASDLNGAIELKGLFGGDAVSGGSQIAQRGQTLVFDRIALNSRDFDFTGQLAYAPDMPLPQGRIDIALRELTALGRALSLPMNGEGSIAIRLDPAAAQPVMLNGRATGVSLWPENKRAWLADEIALNLAIDPVLPFGGPNGEVSFTGLRNHVADFSEILLSLDAQENGVGIGLLARGAPGIDARLDATALLSQTQGGGVMAAVNDLNGRLAAQNIELSKPLIIRIAEDRITVDPFVLRVGPGALSADGQFAGSALNAQLSVEGMDLSFLSPVMSWGTIQGEFDGSFSIMRDGELIDGEYHLQLRDFAVGDVLAKNLVGFSAQGRIRDEQLISSAAFSLGDNQSLSLRAELPVIWPEGSSLRVPPDRPLSAAIEGRFDIAPLWPLTGEYTHIVKGVLETDLQIAGTLSGPDLSGRFVIHDASYRHLISGLSGTADRLQANVDDDRLSFDNVTALGPDNGTITLNGWIRPLGRTGDIADIMIGLDKAQLLNQDDAKVKGDGALRYRRGEGKASLNGEARILRADIQIPDELGAGIVEIQVQEINRPGESDSALPDMPRPVTTSLDFKIRADNQIFLRGRGLDSEWRGDISVGGTLEEPVLNGSVSLVRGTYELFGKRFMLSQGQVNFLGRRTIDPTINATATHEAKSMTVTVRLSGPVSAPQIDISSSPALPRDEIVSRLLFGTSANRLSALQAAQLAGAVASLAGGGGGFDPLGTVRRSLSLDYLDIGSGEEGGQRIRSGKYLTNDVYVEVETAPSGGETTAAVRVDITNNLTAGTSTTAEGTSSVRLEWKWDY